MKSKFIHKIFVIQEKFLVFFSLHRVPDISHVRGSGSGPHYPILYPITDIQSITHSLIGWFHNLLINIHEHWLQ